jgi:hypothetical protein
MFNSIGLFFTSLWPLIKPIVIVLVNMISGKIMETVIEIVQTLQSTGLTNEEKRNLAYYEIRDTLKENGQELSDSMINLLLEMAVQKLKTK